MKTKYANQSLLVSEGFTLIEVLVAISILSLGIMAMYSMQLSAVHINYLGGSATQSGNFSSSQVEEIYSILENNFNNDKLKGRQCVDTDTKPLSNGLPKDCGLNRTGVNKRKQRVSNSEEQPDGERPIDDGRFVVVYNVVKDQPIKGIKKIRVHTLDTSTAMQNPVSLDLLKNNPNPK